MSLTALLARFSSCQTEGLDFAQTRCTIQYDPTCNWQFSSRRPFHFRFILQIRRDCIAEFISSCRILSVGVKQQLSGVCKQATQYTVSDKIYRLVCVLYNATCFGSYTPIFREFTKLWGTKVQDKKKSYFQFGKTSLICLVKRVAVEGGDVRRHCLQHC